MMLPTVLFFLLVRTIASYPVPMATLSPQIDEIAEKVVRCRRLPGLSVAVVRLAPGGGTPQTITRAYGFADTATKRRALPSTRFCVAGLTQAFTAAVLTQLLHENDTYSLDSPVESILGSGFQLIDADLSKKVTPRDILSHRVGVAPYFGGFVLGYNMTRAELVRRLRYVPVVSEFRQSFVPSPLLYVLAGQLVQSLNDTSWENVVTRRIFKPLRMTGSTFADRVPNWAADFALPHVLQDGELFPILSKITGNILRPVGPSGSICSTPDDMSKWMLMLLQNGTFNQPILHSDVVQEMFTPQNPYFPKGGRKSQGKLPVDVTTDAYNLGWISGTYKKRRRFFQNAFSNYYGAFITLLPEEGLGIFTAANGPSLPLMDNSFRVLHYYIMDLALGEDPWLELTSAACQFPHPWFGPSINQSESTIQNESTTRTKSTKNVIQITKSFLSTTVPSELDDNHVSASTNSIIDFVSTVSDLTDYGLSEASTFVSPKPTTGSSTQMKSTFSTSGTQQTTDDDSDYDVFLQSTPFEIYKLQNSSRASSLVNTFSPTTLRSRFKTTQRYKPKIRVKSTKTTRIFNSPSTTQTYADLTTNPFQKFDLTSSSLKEALVSLLSTSPSLQTLNITNTFRDLVHPSVSSQSQSSLRQEEESSMASKTEMMSSSTREGQQTSTTVKNNIRLNHRFPRPHSNKHFKFRTRPSTEPIAISSSTLRPSSVEFTSGFLSPSTKSNNNFRKILRTQVLKKQEPSLGMFGLRIQPTVITETSSSTQKNTYSTEGGNFLLDLISAFPSPIDLIYPHSKSTIKPSSGFTESTRTESIQTSSLTPVYQPDEYFSEDDLEELITPSNNRASTVSHKDTSPYTSQTQDFPSSQKGRLTSQSYPSTQYVKSTTLANATSSSNDHIMEHLLNLSTLISKHAGKLDVAIVNAVDAGVEQISPLTEPSIVTSFLTEESTTQATSVTSFEQYLQELFTNISFSENPLTLLNNEKPTTDIPTKTYKTTEDYEHLNTIKFTSPASPFSNLKRVTIRPMNIQKFTPTFQTKPINMFTASSNWNATSDLSSTIPYSQSTSLQELLEGLDLSEHFKGLQESTPETKHTKVATILASLPLIGIFAPTKQPPSTIGKSPAISSILPPSPSRNTISHIFFDHGLKSTPAGLNNQFSGSTPKISPLVQKRKFPIPSRRRLSSRQRLTKAPTPSSPVTESTASQDDITDVLLHLSTQLLHTTGDVRVKRDAKAVNPYPEHVGTYAHPFFGNVVIFFNRTSETLQMEYGFYGKAHLLPEDNDNTFQMRFFSAIWYASEADDTKRWSRKVFLVHFKRPTANKPPNKLMIPLFEPRRAPVFVRSDI